MFEPSPDNGREGQSRSSDESSEDEIEDINIERIDSVVWYVF